MHRVDSFLALLALVSLHVLCGRLRIIHLRGYRIFFALADHLYVFQVVMLASQKLTRIHQ